MRTILVSLVAGARRRDRGRAADAAAVPGPGPQELIEKVSQDLLHELDANRAALAKDPAKLRALVDKFLLPHFDVDYSARLVLGKYWRTATEQQRKRFSTLSIQSLMRNYGNALLEFTADRLMILPFKGDPAADQRDGPHARSSATTARRCRSTTRCTRRRRAGRPGTSRSRASRT